MSLAGFKKQINKANQVGFSPAGSHFDSTEEDTLILILDCAYNFDFRFV